MVTNILLLHCSKSPASIPIQLTPHTAAKVSIPRMQSLPAFPLYKVPLWLPVSFRKVSKIFLRVQKVLMSYILFTSPQHLLPRATLNSILQLKGTYPVPQTPTFSAFKHATTSSPEHSSSLLPNTHSYFIWVPTSFRHLPSHPTS